MKKILLILYLCPFWLFSQSDTLVGENLSIEKGQGKFFEPAHTFSQKRFYAVSSLGLVAYTSFSVGLYNAWYKNFPRSNFHLFNDLGEWEYMDKFGHIFSGYFQSTLTYQGAKWAGLSDNKAIWTGIACGTLFQTTLEIMDGYSSEWGFSIPDMASNTIGISTFAFQQKYWREQRITLKESAWPTAHDNNYFINSVNGEGDPVSLKQRANQLYGSSWGERFLKDYNAQTYWASVNVKSFLDPSSKWPSWLNVAVGYSAENMYGGYENSWITNGISYDATNIERYHQILLALDVDLRKLKTKNHFVKSLLSVANIFKIPSPAIEFTTRGEILFHFVYF